MNRRITLIICLFLGITPALRAQEDSVTTSDIKTAGKLFDLHFTDAKRDLMVPVLQANLAFYRFLHSKDLPNSVPMSLSFDPTLPGMHFSRRQLPLSWNIPANVDLPADRNRLAFYSIPQLASLLRSKKITSVALTRFFLERLRQYGPMLHCVIELTEDIAMKEAGQADADFAHGVDRGPLQGIPYGIKDLFAVKGTHTTWGTPPYREQVIDQTSFIARQLEKAGAVLVAKLSLGELAMDDVWFGGLTRNPWDTSVGSGGSSAGSASATAAGLVPFAIGTETYGSIVDPSMRCGATGLRPTFGSIARTGCMALCWSSDKVGLLCRSAEDDAIVFAYAHGGDSSDASSRTMPFNYTGKVNWSTLRIAYARNYIDTLAPGDPIKQAMAVLTKLGAHLVPMDFPDNLRGNDVLNVIVGAEAAAAFDALTRNNLDDQMVQQGGDRWPNVFRSARFVPAVEYINAVRMRYRIMQLVHAGIDQYDLIIAPPETGDQLAITNLTGNPSVTMPLALMANGRPASVSFIGRIYGEAQLLAVAKAFQDATAYNKIHPKQFE